MQRICVFSGSSEAGAPRYLEAAAGLGTLLAERNIGLVYGGAAIGSMGAIADAVQAAGGHVTGVIPRALVEMEVAHRGLADLRIVGSMHERKALMAELADAFIALPGGIGTLEELFEIWTLNQLAYLEKPLGLLNVGGYYDRLLTFLDHVVAESFLTRVHRELLCVEGDPKALLDVLTACSSSDRCEWRDRESVSLRFAGGAW